jgi:hypothetical protein
MQLPIPWIRSMSSISKANKRHLHKGLNRGGIKGGKWDRGDKMAMECKTWIRGEVGLCVPRVKRTRRQKFPQLSSFTRRSPLSRNSTRRNIQEGIHQGERTGRTHTHTASKHRQKRIHADLLFAHRRRLVRVSLSLPPSPLSPLSRRMGTGVTKKHTTEDTDQDMGEKLKQRKSVCRLISCFHCRLTRGQAECMLISGLFIAGDLPKQLSRSLPRAGQKPQGSMRQTQDGNSKPQFTRSHPKRHTARLSNDLVIAFLSLCLLPFF